MYTSDGKSSVTDEINSTSSEKSKQCRVRLHRWNNNSRDLFTLTMLTVLKFLFVLLLLFVAVCATYSGNKYVRYSYHHQQHQSHERATIPPARPPPQDRRFVSEAVEQLIANVSAKIADPDLRQLFINCLPSTLDTTVYYHKPSSAGPPVDFIPYTYIVTGDILAMWLRDSTYQVNPYIPLARDDTVIRDLILGVINTQAEMILKYPWGNAFFPLPEWNSGIVLPDPERSDIVRPVYNTSQVFEAKYELDSLASFLYLSKTFYENTGDASFLLNPRWSEAILLVVQTMREQQGGTVEMMDNPPFKFSRQTTTQSETTNLYGVGNPVKRCGLVRSFFRPSDDSTIFQYLIPSNAMAVVGLNGVANVLDSNQVLPELSAELKALAAEIDAAINRYAMVQHPEFGTVFAYEVDCYGSHVFMDDANFPSLLSLPKFGYIGADDPVYLNTRKYVLSADWNPYFANGLFPGVGSPHTGLQKPWHMAQAMQAMTSRNETEIRQLLTMLRDSTGGTGFMHESYNVNNPSDYTRAWFAWANTVFGDLILFVEKEFPQILESVLPRRRHGY